MIGNLPPFLFYRGKLNQRDARSIAIVGTRPGVRGRAAAGGPDGPIVRRSGRRDRLPG
ncbi:DNA-protecting protein DprA [Streptomyces sp. MBT49]|uniref:DNA-protecting protein DprA n=1 Tax=Streptomyces sp. MBT49 TaxID=1488380 RepID=UPI001F226FB5